MTAAQARALFTATAEKPSKYRSKRTTVAGLTFDSKAEGARYAELSLMLRAGLIRDLQTQRRFPLVVNGQKIATYVADFSYFDVATGASVVEDVKSVATLTPTFRLKEKLMVALHGIVIKRVF